MAECPPMVYAAYTNATGIAHLWSTANAGKQQDRHQRRGNASNTAPTGRQHEQAGELSANPVFEVQQTFGQAPA